MHLIYAPFLKLLAYTRAIRPLRFFDSKKEVSARTRIFYQPCLDVRGITRVIKPRGLQTVVSSSRDIIAGPADGPKRPRGLVNAALLAASLNHGALNAAVSIIQRDGERLDRVAAWRSEVGRP